MGQVNKSTSNKRIFISHTAADKPLVDAFVNAICDVLKKDVDDLFFYSAADSGLNMAIPGGKSVTGGVVEAFNPKKTSCVISFVTNKSYRKPWLHFEAGGAFAKTILITLFLPSSPPPNSEEIPEYLRYGKYYDLREINEANLGQFFAEVGTLHLGVNETYLEAQKKEFIQKFMLHSREQLADQVAAVCICQFETTKEPQVLLVKNRDKNSKGKFIPGKRRHFPKEDLWYAGQMLQPNVIAAIGASKEAGVVATPAQNLGTFLHFKHDKDKTFTVIAYAMEYHAESAAESGRANVKERDPQWYTEKQALTEVQMERKPKYVAELRRIIKLAFAEWNKRNGR